MAKENEGRLIGQRVLGVTSHGKHLIGRIQNKFYFHSHLMMWGRWQTFPNGADPDQGARPKNKKPAATVVTYPQDKDRRERARIVVDGGAAILFSAPIFNVGEGDPYAAIENLATLGPDVIPVKGKFNQKEFFASLLPEHRDIAVGAALLNQRILAGLGNYLRAEVLFSCEINPWRKVGDLTQQELRCLSREATRLSVRAYRDSATAADEDRVRMNADASLVYQPGREYGTRHMVFRRTNLPCLRCGEPIKQLRQATYNAETSLDGEEGEERTRIVYFCAKCQKVDS